MADRLHLFIEKNRYKFSAAHFTLFDDGSKETLHGHNYQLKVSLELGPEQFVPFSSLKKSLGDICLSLDEKVLIPCASSRVKTTTLEDSIEVRVDSDRYVFPLTDVELLNQDNITVENLCKECLSRLQDLLIDFIESRRLHSLTVSVVETEGQGARLVRSYDKAIPEGPQ